MKDLFDLSNCGNLDLKYRFREERERREGRDEVNREEMEEERGRKLVGRAIWDADEASVGNTSGRETSQLFNSIPQGVNS